MTAPAIPSRDDDGTTTGPRCCPVCGRGFFPLGRQAYCSTACRKRAFRRRHAARPAPRVPAGQPKRDRTVYECPTCGERRVGAQRCEDCGGFGRAVGLGGACPHCAEPITLDDLDLTRSYVAARD